VLRLCVALFAILAALPLVAAGPATFILGTPTLLVYPFAANGSEVSKEAGSRLAITIATQIANLGGIDVKPAPPGVDRHDYLEAAHHEGVDYYIAGYVTPLGDGVSVVEQLVSTQTGIVVYSNTAQVRTYADAAGQGDVLRDALLRHQSRNLGAYAAPPPPVGTPSPTPAPGSAAAANLGRLFGRRQKQSEAPPASPRPAAGTLATTVAAVSTAAPAARKHHSRVAASAPPPNMLATPAPIAPKSPAALVALAAPERSQGFGMLGIGGSAQSDRRTFAVAAIRNVMIANHQRVTDAAGANQSACSAANVGTLLGGNLSTRNHTILGEPQTITTLELLAYDCTGSIVYRKTFARDARGDWKAAVDRVVQSAVAEFLREPAGSRKG
jgi:TolB-like protein